ncbi:MAG TPA: GntR family transcriptional regulator [Anaerolineae bacterium]|nr:GntR family transcriptional regulator [Anaerolineae bacterium]
MLQQKPVQNDLAKPLYRTILESLRQQIASGDLKVNERIPSENELGRIYSAGRNTVRRALSELSREGLVRTIPGLGTFVVEPKWQKSAEYLFGFSQEMRLHGKQVATRVLEARLIPATPYLATHLHIAVGEEIFFLSRLRFLDGEPVAIECAHLPHSLCLGILQYDLAQISLYQILSTVYDRKPDHADQEIEARITTPEIAATLGVSHPSSIFLLRRETYLASGQVIEYVESELRGDRFRFQASLRAPTGTDSLGVRRSPVVPKTLALDWLQDSETSLEGGGTIR